MDGYGCPVCMNCLLEERLKILDEGRKAAKSGQYKQIDRMINESKKVSKNLQNVIANTTHFRHLYNSILFLDLN